MLPRFEKKAKEEAPPFQLNREFDAPTEKWVTDVAEFRVGDRKLYLSPVMDLFDRQIISHSISPSPNLVLTNTCSVKLAMASSFAATTFWSSSSASVEACRVRSIAFPILRRTLPSARTAWLLS